MALKTQTVPPARIWVWNNDQSNAYRGEELIVINSSHNLGCFARFSLAGMTQSDAVMVLDDDTVPGCGWAKNCIDTMSRFDGNAILGCRGVILTRNAYTPFHEAGLAKQNEHTQECDLVGHSWFFMREFAHFMFDAQPVSWSTGEDMHFSAYAKMSGVRTYCPPHPKSNKNVWGSVRRELGNAHGRISTRAGLQPHFQQRSRVVKGLIERGWKPLFMEKK
jgi:hypothetical protein